MDKSEKKKKFIINFIYLLLIGVIVYFIFKYALILLMPFVIGFGIAYMLKPLIIKTSKSLKMGRKLSAGLILTIFYLTVGALITVLIVKITMYLKDLFSTLPNLYINTIEPAVYDLVYKGDTIIQNLDPEFVTTLGDIVLSFTQTLGSTITNLSSYIVRVISSTVSVVPGFLILILFLIISSYFFATDYDRVVGFVSKQLSKNTIDVILQIKNCISNTVFKFVKAYIVLIALTFIEMLIGLKILGIENIVLISAFTAIVDLLPILGTGSVLLPWALFEIIKGNIVVGLGIMLIYILITIVRNIIEPKLLGKELGLEPILVLICMYLGLKVFGIIGIFGLPLLLIILIDLNKSGKIKLFK